MSNRDDFSIVVKRVLAQRAGHLCSHPDCRKLTIQAHSDPEKSLSNGVAAHINAASKNGPRFDSNQSREERSNIRNAIFLCHNHSDIIDKDENAYPPKLLHEWKVKHEEFIKNGGGLLNLPNISINTTEGLTIPTTSPIRITGNDISNLREHIITIENPNKREFTYFHSRIQFPEFIVHTEILDSPIGTAINCAPDRPNIVVNASGSGSVEIQGGERPTMDYLLEIDKLPALKIFRIKFITKAHPEPDGYILGFNKDTYTHYLLGDLQHEYYGEQINRIFVTKFQYTQETRCLNSLPCEEYNEDCKISHRVMSF